MTLLLRRLGGACARNPWATLGGWLAFAAVVTALSLAFGGAYTNSGALPGTAAQTGASFLARYFPAATKESALVVVHTPSGTLRSGVPAAGLRRVVAAVRRLPEVAEVSTQFSADQHSALLTVGYDRPRFDVPPSAITVLERAAAQGRRDHLQVGVAGNLVYDQHGAATGLAEEIGIGIALLVLIAGFGSVVAAIMPMVTAAFSLTVGLGLVKLLATGYAVNGSAPSLATMIGLGVGIDYALFIVTRHRELLAVGTDPKTAAAAANATAGSSVLYAGVTVIAAILGLRFAGIPLVTSLGAAAALVVAVAVIAALTLLPALLGLVGPRVNALRLYHLPVVHRHSPLDPGVHPGEPSSLWWWRWAHHVELRPKRYIAGSVLFLVALALPVAALRLGQPDGSSAPRGSNQYVAHQLAARAFGPGVLAPILVGAAPARPAQLSAIETRLSAIPGVASVSPPRLDPSRDAALLEVLPRHGVASVGSLALSNRLQNQVLPELHKLTGAQLILTGRLPGMADVAAEVHARLLVFIAAVLAVSFLLLTFVFRSLLVALKAVVMNIFSISAAYGATVAVFQWGWLRELVGLPRPVPIVDVVPMFMFAIVFGLSMDYEVFLLSRVREEWTHTHDARGSVVMGLTHTARVITAAALIMITIFSSFVTTSSVVVKMMGFGLAVAVLIDATVVRLVLVPATMALLGELNWWLPGWLDRLLPHVDIEGAVAVTPAGGILEAVDRYRRPEQEGVPQ